MKLDDTRIVIRYRTRADVLDLSLKMIRVYAGPILIWLAAGVAPMFLLNAWLLHGFAFYDFVWGLPVSYMVLTTLLVFLEMPLATAPLTLLLGQIVFMRRPDRRSLLRDLRGSLPQLLLFQVVLRPLSVLHPYLNEIILLERNPLRGNGRGAKTTGLRSRELHRDESADLIINGFLNFVLGLILFSATWVTLALLRTLFFGDWDLVTGEAVDRPMYTTYYHQLLWTIVGYTTVLRFLSYLNLRIRREGWDVELQVRAERARLDHQVS
ncbi:MAG: hypothetical protein ACYC6Y_11605 [Thermoguttaceae bacterium]